MHENSRMQSLSRRLTVLALALTLAVGGVALLLKPRASHSAAERRALALWPRVALAALLEANWIEDLELALADHFPARQGWRALSAWQQLYLNRQADYEGYYRLDTAQGGLARIEYPLDERGLRRALERLAAWPAALGLDAQRPAPLYIVPPRSDFAPGRQPSLSWTQLADASAPLLEGTPLELLSYEGLLDAEAYYETDIHWRQERLLPLARALLQRLLGDERVDEARLAPASYRLEDLGPFAGGHAAAYPLPVPGERLLLLQSPELERMRVVNLLSGAEGGVYDPQQLEGVDPYSVFLAGPEALLEIHNENAASPRSLILIRDSFGSSLAPLLATHYRRTIVVDPRYIASPLAAGRIALEVEADVLIVVSATLLNRGQLIRP